jgi:hypothetical protein
LNSPKISLAGEGSKRYRGFTLKSKNPSQILSPFQTRNISSINYKTV